MPRGTAYDYYFSFRKPEGEFVSWDEIIPEFEYDLNMSFFDIVVPTKDTACFSWFLDKNIKLLNPIFITGTTGTGKTIIVNTTLEKLKHE